MCKTFLYGKYGATHTDPTPNIPFNIIIHCILYIFHWPKVQHVTCRCTALNNGQSLIPFTLFFCGKKFYSGSCAHTHKWVWQIVLFWAVREPLRDLYVFLSLVLILVLTLFSQFQIMPSIRIFSWRLFQFLAHLSLVRCELKLIFC